MRAGAGHAAEGSTAPGGRSISKFLYYIQLFSSCPDAGGSLLYCSHDHADDSRKTREELIEELRELRRFAAAREDPEGLAERERSLQLIAGNVHEVIFMFTPDWQKAIYVSPAYEKIWGRQVDEVYRDARAWMAAIVPEDRNMVESIIAAQSRGEIPAEINVDYRIRTPGGEVRWINGRTYPVRDRRGRVTRISGIAEDITARRQAEDRLRANERFLNNIFDCFQDGISILDDKLNVVRVNHVMEKWHPYMVPIEGKKCYHAYHERSVPCEKCPSIRAMAEKAATSEVVEFHGQDGRPRGWLEVYAFPLKDDEGNVIGVIEHVRDITARKQAEESLQLMRHVIDHAQDWAALIAPDGRFIYVNDAHCRALGYSREELLAMRIWEVDIDLTAENWPGIWSNLKRVGFIKTEDMHRAKDGRTFPTEIWASYFDFHGTEYLCGFVRDISGRKRAEKALRLTQFSIDRASDMAVWLGPDATISYVNEAYCRETGYAARELIGRKVFDVNPNFDAANWTEHWEEMRQRGAASFESTIRRKDGTVFPAEISVNVLNYEGQELHCTFVRNITERKRAEESLLLLQHMIDQTEDEVSLATPDGRFVYVNDAKCRSLGYTKEELLSLHIWDVDPGMTRERWLLAWQDLKARRHLKRETMHRTKDGRVFPSEIWSNYLDFNGQEYVCAFVRDITERKETEKSLKLTQFTMDRAADMILWVAPDSRYVYVNESACRGFGYTREELLARTTFDTRPEWTPESWAEHWNEIKERGSFTFETTLRRKDGSFFPGEISVNYVVYGGKEYNCSFIRDISERKCAEEALRESEEKFRVLAETTKAGIMLYRGEDIVYVNPALEKLSGYGRDELMKMSYWELADPEHREMVRSRGLARQRGTGKGPATYELKVRTKSGETRWVELSAALITYHGRQTGLATIFDITDRKRFEQELQEAKQQVELYLDLMGHDINNLNQIAVGFLEMALADPEIGAGTAEFVARPLEAIRASSQLIANVRKLQKIREGGLKFREIRIADKLREIIPRYGDVPGRVVRIACDIGNESTVMANDLLDDVFSNIIHNAIKHSAGPLSIDVHLTTARVGDREYALIAIEDDGPGIPDELKGRLFSRTGQGAAKATGRGLGLHLVRTLVEDFHGKVWVEDRVQGDYSRGTRFMIMLPATEPDDAGKRGEKA